MILAFCVLALFHHLLSNCMKEAKSNPLSSIMKKMLTQKIPTFRCIKPVVHLIYLKILEKVTCRTNNNILPILLPVRFNVVARIDKFGRRTSI
jgi:hypothetical protein